MTGRIEVGDVVRLAPAARRRTGCSAVATVDKVGEGRAVRLRSTLAGRYDWTVGDLEVAVDHLRARSDMRDAEFHSELNRAGLTFVFGGYIARADGSSDRRLPAIYYGDPVNLAKRETLQAALREFGSRT